MTLAINSSNYNINDNYGVSFANTATSPVSAQPKKNNAFELSRYTPAHLVRFNTRLNKSEQEKYNELVKMLATADPKELHALPEDTISVTKKLDALLKNGRLLDKNSNDRSTTLDNLYKIATTPRMSEIPPATILGETISAIYQPEIITQQFGDIPNDVKNVITRNPDVSLDVKSNPQLLDVGSSSTCVAASIEFNLANKRPAEFARWVEGLSSQNGSVEQKVKLSSLSKLLLNAVWLLNAFELKPKEFNFDSVLLEFKTDKNADMRAKNQSVNWDPGERSIIDVLLQSAFMQMGSQQAYDSLTDTRGGNFQSSPQGLVEFEKTFVESILADKEKFAVVYQNVTPDQKVTGYRTSFDVIEKHIKESLDGGEDVIAGYVLTDPADTIETGHEITIVGYRADKDGKTIFKCKDTDDGKRELVEYSAEYLVPKIHHAGFSEHILRNERYLLDPDAAA